METTVTKKEMAMAMTLGMLWTQAWNLHKGEPVHGELTETDDGLQVVAVPVYLDPPKAKTPIGFFHTK